MSYRTFKRILGESHLERKCRVLFGTSLFLLVMGSFWLYGMMTDRLVIDSSRDTCRHLVDAGMIKTHARHFQKEFGAIGEGKAKLLSDAFDDMENLSYEWELITLNDPARDLTRWEKDELDGLRAEFLTWLAAELQEGDEQSPLSAMDQSATMTTETASPDGDEVDTVETTDPIKRDPPPFVENHVGPKYNFYQPVNFTVMSCGLKGNCHGSDDRRLGQPLSSLLRQDVADVHLPFEVVKVTIDYDPTRKQIARNRAILLATAIITVFVAMIALYVVVRYVIVKPLQHLHDVTEEVSHGKYDLRASIQTNDEFEQLAVSFNRMLRHLVEAHEELRDLNENLDAKVDELAQANMQLFEANRLKSDFLANMSHELRTPLNSIIGFADVLQGITALNEKQKRYAQNIGQSGRVLLEMINEILDLAKMESGKMEVSPTEFSIAAVVGAQCDMVRALSEEKNVDLKISCQPDLPDMFQDQGKVQQILTNLLSNAIKFTPDGGRIDVSVSRSARSDLELQVKDTGVGISDEDRDVIFEKFRQGTMLKFSDNLTREYTGTGLGLSIVKELCKLLGGEITFESELGKGSSFLVRIPWALISPSRSTVSIGVRTMENANAETFTNSQGQLGESANVPADSPQFSNSISATTTSEGES